MEEWLYQANRSMGKAFDESVRLYPSREALVFRQERCTYKQLAERVNRLAKGLLRLGARKGDHVAIWSTNNLEWIYAQFAVHKLGGTVIPVNPRYQAPELEYVLRQADCTAFIFKDNFLGKIDTASMVQGIVPALHDSEPGRLSEKKLPMLKSVICLSERRYPGMYGFGDIMEMGDGPSLDEELVRAVGDTSPDDIAFIMYTSGTTGRSKGAMIPCRNTLAQMYLYNRYHMIDRKSRLICAFPLSSSVGCNLSVSSALLCGASSSVLESWNTEQALSLIQNERITHINVVPSMAIMMVNDPALDTYDLSSLEVWASGGAPLPLELTRRFREKVPFKALVHGYGLVEATGIISTCSSLDATIEVAATTVGKPWPYCRIKIVDPLNFEEMPEGKEGEIWTTDNSFPRAHVMKGYYKEPEETERTIVDGWLRTGDMGVIRQGQLTVTGRLKDMILVGGFNTYPAEIEEIIRNHPKVKDVSVVGVPDQRLQEVPMAFVMLRDGEECAEAEIIDFCRSKMSNFKVPRRVTFLTEFPLAGVGKIQKFRLREMAAGEFGAK